MSNNLVPWKSTDKRWRTIYRWLWVWSPDDCQQCVELAFILLGNNAKQGAVEEVVRYQLKLLRHEVWDIKPSKLPKYPRSLKPSRCSRRTGYRLKN